MFGYIKKSRVLKIIEKGQEQLRDKRDELVLSRPTNDFEKQDFVDSLNRLDGGIYFLECLKKHFTK